MFNPGLKFSNVSLFKTSTESIMKNNPLYLTAIAIFMLNQLASAAADFSILCPKPLRATPAHCTKKGYIILILGSSSVGKSRISGEVVAFLKKMMGLPEVIKIAQDTEEDDWGISSKLTEQFPKSWTTEHIHLFQIITQKALEDKVVICDLILRESNDYDITECFIKKLRQVTQVFSILVYCSIARLISNVMDRNSTGCERESRSPFSTMHQYFDVYLSPIPSDSTNEVINTLSAEDLEDGIKKLRTLEEPKVPHGETPRETCVNRMLELQTRTPSPILWDKGLYDYVIKNGECDLPKEIGCIYYKLFSKLNQQY